MTEYDYYIPSAHDLSDKGDADPTDPKEIVIRRERRRAYSREVKRSKDERLKKVIKTYNFKRCPGYIEPSEDYIRHPSRSRAQKFLKHYTNKLARKTSLPPKGSKYRRCLEYEWWIH